MKRWRINCRAIWLVRFELIVGRNTTICLKIICSPLVGNLNLIANGSITLQISNSGEAFFNWQKIQTV